MMATPGAFIVVMGVSAVGKSSVGRALADGLAVPFVDADDLHPAANVAKMRAQIPLTDADRRPWLTAVGTSLAAHPEGVVLACSALRRSYRDQIRQAVPATVFIHLSGSTDLLAARAAARTGHFMPPELLASQLAILQPLAADEVGTTLDVTATVAELVVRARQYLRNPGG